MNDGKEILIFHSPVLMTLQSVEGEIAHWANYSVCRNRKKKQELNK
jgi:hypothetical protein